MDRLKKLQEDKDKTAKEIERLMTALMSSYPEIKDLEIRRHSYYDEVGRLMVALYGIEVTL